MQVFNTLTRRKEELKPIMPGNFRIYAVSYTHLDVYKRQACPLPRRAAAALESVYPQKHRGLAEEGVPLKKKGIFL